MTVARAQPQPEEAPRESLKIVIVGHVDHGKSTLIGRLFHDTGSLPDGRMEQITEMCRKRGMPFEWSFLMDALQTERDQGITIDTTQIWFRSARRDYVIIDAPGHREFLKNMVTGAAGAEAALLLIDAEEGVKEQSRRHAYLLHLLGVRQVAVLVNKMDRVGHAEARFDGVAKEIAAYLGELGIIASAIIPISARDGDMIVARGEKLGWYRGPNVIDALDGFRGQGLAASQAFRMAVQDVYKFDERRIVAGRIASGSVTPGDPLLISPGGMRVRVKSVEGWPTAAAVGLAGQSVGLTFDEQVFCERGHVLSHESEAPILANRFGARLFWLGQEALVPGKRYQLKLGTQSLACELSSVRHVIDTETLSPLNSDRVERNQVAEVELRVRGLAVLDPFDRHPETGRFVLVDGYDIAGGGIVDLIGVADQRVSVRKVKSENITPELAAITPEQRALHNGHTGGILWFTGLSGSGKSTLALELQRRLFERGYQVFVLDGDNIRAGLNADLGFSAEDRSENIRRVGEVAALFAQAGMLVISAFISPYREDRRRARGAAPEMFHTVYIKADVATCEQRDVKGLYKKAREGKIADFTGISAPYEEPESPELVLDTMQDDVEACIARLVDYVARQFTV